MSFCLNANFSFLGKFQNSLVPEKYLNETNFASIPVKVAHQFGKSLEEAIGNLVLHLTTGPTFL